MKALTLTEPYATLIARSAKTIETRSWYTDHRGPIAIHAAKGMPVWAVDTMREPGPIRDAILPDGGWPWGRYQKDVMGRSRGHVLAIARLVAVFPTRDVLQTKRLWSPYAGEVFLTEDELALGDYAPGRFAWRLVDVTPLPEPIPARGALGLWDWPPPPGWRMPRSATG